MGLPGLGLVSYVAAAATDVAVAVIAYPFKHLFAKYLTINVDEEHFRQMEANITFFSGGDEVPSD